MPIIPPSNTDMVTTDNIFEPVPPYSKYILIKKNNNPIWINFKKYRKQTRNCAEVYKLKFSINENKQMHIKAK